LNIVGWFLIRIVLFFPHYCLTSRYVETTGTACGGSGGTCTWSGNIDWGNGTGCTACGDSKHYDSSVVLVQACKDKCDLHADCAGFNHEHSTKRCYYRIVLDGGVTCSTAANADRDCYQKLPAPTPPPTPAPTALPNCPIACSGYSGGANASQVRVCLEVSANSAGVITGGRGVCVYQDTDQLPNQCNTVNVLGAASTGQVRLCKQIHEAAPAACPAPCASFHAGADATSPVCYKDSSKQCVFKYPYTDGVTPTSHFCTKYDYYDRVCMPVTPVE
jgi:hypothetical protein